MTLSKSNSNAHPNDPTAFGTMDCGDGITITKPARMYLVHDDGLYVGCQDTLAGAFRMVHAIKAK